MKVLIDLPQVIETDCVEDEQAVSRFLSNLEVSRKIKIKMVDSCGYHSNNEDAIGMIYVGTLQDTKNKDMLKDLRKFVRKQNLSAEPAI